MHFAFPPYVLIQKAKDKGWGHYDDETFSEKKSTG
jgi:hypothetical protein